MTRINLLPPRLLTDQHLIAEKKEINQLAGQFRKSLYSKKGFVIPKKFTLNTGHVKFFYDKGLFLSRRYNALSLEMSARKYSVNTEFNGVLWMLYPQYFNDYTPSREDYEIIIERITLRVSEKPNFYTYRGEKINFIEYRNMISDWFLNL